MFEAAISLLPVLPPEEVMNLVEIRLGLLQKTIEEIEEEERICKKMNLPRLFSLESEYFKAMTLAEYKFSKDLLTDLRRDSGGLRTGWAKMRNEHLAAKADARKKQGSAVAVRKNQKKEGKS